jgi:3-oxoacyl-[acyl-carrier protein] reductase
MLEGKVALVTGAASGIGKDAAVRMLKNGAKVIACDIDVKAFWELAKEAGGKEGELLTVGMDVSDAASFDGVIRLVEQGGGLDILVNCAGICSGTSIEDIGVEEWDSMFDVNIKGMFFLTRALIPHIKRGGTIINVSSMAGFTGGIKSNPAYSCSKAAVTCMTKNLAKYCADKGIRVNEVSPGTAVTPMTLNWMGKDGLEGLGKNVPLKRLAQPSDIGKAILFFASDGSSFITGQSLQVNGGMYIP